MTPDLMSVSRLGQYPGLSTGSLLAHGSRPSIWPQTYFTWSELVCSPRPGTWAQTQYMVLNLVHDLVMAPDLTGGVEPVSWPQMPCMAPNLAHGVGSWAPSSPQGWQQIWEQAQLPSCSYSSYYKEKLFSFRLPFKTKVHAIYKDMNSRKHGIIQTTRVVVVQPVLITNL